MVTTARVCIFCGQPAGSGEHGFPDWLNGVFPAQEVGPTDVQFGSVTPIENRQNTWSTKKIASQRLKAVCGSCNTGWMSHMEGDTKPVLLPMVQGTPTTLTMLDQLAVAARAVKTAMVLEHTPRSGQRFTEMDRRTVMRDRRPPAHILVTACAIEGNAGPLQFALAHGLVHDHAEGSLPL